MSYGCRFFPGVLLLTFLFLASVPAVAGNDGGIVVYRLEQKRGVHEKDIDSISNFIASQVEKYSGRKVISEADMRTILRGEEIRQKCGSEDTSCVAEIGAALGVPEAVSGDLGKLESFWMLNLRRINVNPPEVIKRSSRDIEGTMDDLIRALPGAVAELFGLQAGEKPKVFKAPTTGALAMNSKPEGAEVKIDGRTAGRTPLEKSLKVGTYKVRLERRGYRSRERDIRILPGETTELVFELERIPPGRLYVESEPSGAALLLDGTEKGRTPFEQKLEVGEYKLELKLDGYKTTEESVTVKSEETMRLSLTMERDYPMNPYKKWGHAAFWSGLGISAIMGGLGTGMAKKTADDYKAGDPDKYEENGKWAGVMYSGWILGGSLMVTGIVLWALSPGDREWYEKHAVSAAPSDDGKGGLVSFSRSW